MHDKNISAYDTTKYKLTFNDNFTEIYCVSEKTQYGIFYIDKTKFTIELLHLALAEEEYLSTHNNLEECKAEITKYYNYRKYLDFIRASCELEKNIKIQLQTKSLNKLFGLEKGYSV